MSSNTARTTTLSTGQALWAVWRKEWQDAWSDKRGTHSALLYALLGPILLFFVLQSLIQQSRSEQPIAVALVGAEVWPDFATQVYAPRLTWQNMSAPEAEAALRSKKVAAVLTLASDTAQRLQQGAAMQITLQHRSDRDSTSAVQLLTRQLKAMAQQLAQARLLARGVAPQLVEPLDLSVHSIDASDRSQLLGMFAMVLLIGAFFASMNVAIDCTAGERERESLEVLLSQPPNYFTLIFGKYLVVLAFALIGSLLTVLVARLLLGQLVLYELPLQLALAPRAWLLLALLSLPFAMLMSALQMAFALLAKNYKEAQIYLTMLAFVPTLLSLPLAEKLPAHWPIPVVGEHRLMQLVLRGETLPAWPVISLLLVAAVIALLSLWFCARSMGQERMLRAA